MNQEPGQHFSDRPVAHTDVRDHEAVQVKNRVQFGPIIAGVITAITTMLILSVLGLAIGTSALEPREAGESLGTAAAIWGIASAVIAFFLGGFVAAKTAAVAGAGSGLINGFMVGAAILTLLLWLTGSGVTAMIGTLGSNIGDIVNVAQDQGTSTQEVQSQAQEAQEQIEEIDPNAAFNAVEDAAWGTLVGILIPLAAAAIGGLVGKNERDDVIQGR